MCSLSHRVPQKNVSNKTFVILIKLTKFVENLREFNLQKNDQ
jgi:hypothetical protein